MTTTDKGEYWDERARKFGAVGNGLKAVCSYGMPFPYNAYINIIQKRALSAVMNLRVGEAILELGCGVGRWSLEMARKGAAVTGMDISEEMIRIAGCRARAEGLSILFLVSSIAELDVEPASFDRVLAVTVLQHILSTEELKRSAAVISGALRRGGTLILLEVAPYKQTWKCDTEVFKARTYESYKGLFGAYGMSLEDVRAVDPSPFKRWLLPYYKKLPAWMRRVTITAVALLSLLVDFPLTGTRGLVAYSWHKVMVFRKL